MAALYSQRTMMVAGSVPRLAYALGLLLAPRSMSRVGLIGPDPPDPFARMTTRAFGALHVNLGLHTIRSALSDRNVGFVLALNLTSDLADTLGPTLEWKLGDLPTWAALANATVQSFSMVTWSTLLWRRARLA